MKILHVYRTCYPETKGGLEQVIRFITSGVQVFGVECRILSLSDTADKTFFHEGTEIILKKKEWEVASNGFSLSLIGEFRRQAEWADIIHYHYPWPTGDLLSFFSINKPSLVTYHSDIIRQRFLKLLYKPLEYFFLKRVSRIVTTSPQYLSSSQTLKPYHDKCSVIPLGIDPSSYFEADAELLSQWRLRVGEEFFLFVGVLRYYKGLNYLIDAAEISGLPVVIAGDGPLREELETLVTRKHLTNVILVGHISEEDKMALLTLCLAFVFPSHLRSEAFGISLVEAQLFRKPIISCDVGTGSSFVNIDQKTGFVVPPCDPEAIAKSMQILQNESKLRSVMGENGYTRMMTHFTAEEMAHRYYAEYQLLYK